MTGEVTKKVFTIDVPPNATSQWQDVRPKNYLDALFKSLQFKNMPRKIHIIIEVIEDE